MRTVLIATFVFFSVIQYSPLLADTKKVLNLKNSTGGSIKAFVTYISEPTDGKKYEGCDDCIDAPKVWEISPWVELDPAQEMSWEFDQDICVSAWRDEKLPYFKTGKYWRFPTHTETPKSTTWLIFPSNDGARKVVIKDTPDSYKSIEGKDFGDLKNKLTSDGIINLNLPCRYTSLSTDIELGSGKGGLLKNKTSPNIYSLTEKLEIVNNSPNVIEIAYNTAAERTNTLMDGGMFRDEKAYRLYFKGWIELQPGKNHIVDTTYTNERNDKSGNTYQRGICVTARKKGSKFDNIGLTAREGPRYSNYFITNGYFESYATWIDDVFKRYVAYADDKNKSITVKDQPGVDASVKKLREDHDIDLAKFKCRTYDANTTIFID